MKPSVKTRFSAELASADDAELAKDRARSWKHLERAHVLSQRDASAHVRVHRLMLGFAWRRHDMAELRGQLIRMVVAAPGSWLGRAPKGNTGGSNGGLFSPMPIPEDLQHILKDG